MCAQSDVFTRRLHGTLAAAAERGPVDFPELLLTPGVGARTVQSLAMVAEVVHGAPYRFRIRRVSRSRTAARTAIPIPCRSRSTTRPSVSSNRRCRTAKLGRDEELQALKRLDDQARALERTAERAPSLEVLHRHRRARSPAFDGRSVFGWRRILPRPRNVRGPDEDRHLQHQQHQSPSAEPARLAQITKPDIVCLQELKCA